MTSGGCEVDVGPRSNNVLDSIIERSNDSQDSWGSQDRQYSTSLVRNSLYHLLHTSWLMGNAPLRHLASTRLGDEARHTVDHSCLPTTLSDLGTTLMLWPLPCDQKKQRCTYYFKLCISLLCRSSSNGLHGTLEMNVTVGKETITVQVLPNDKSPDDLILSKVKAAKKEVRKNSDST